MDEILNSLRGHGLPSVPGDFREYAYASVWRVLYRRRWANRGRMALIVGMGVCLVWITSILLPRVVRKSYLKKLPLDELIAVHQECVGGDRVAWAIIAPSLRKVIEKSDLLVYARVVDVIPNRGDIINEIVEAKGVMRKIKGMLNNMFDREVFTPMKDNNIRVNLRLTVSKSHPPTEMRELTAIRRGTIGELYYIKNGYEGIFALRRLGGKRSRLYQIAVRHGGIYLIDQERRVVSGVPSATEGRPPDKAWEFMCDLYDSIHGDEEARAAAFDKELSLFRSSEELDECYSALVLLHCSAGASVSAKDSADAIERFYRSAKSDADDGELLESRYRDSYLRFVRLALRVVKKVVDEENLDRICALYAEDGKRELSIFKYESCGIFEEVVRLVLKIPGPNRVARLEQVFKARSDAEYDQIGTWEELRKKHLIQPVHSAVRALTRDYGEDIEVLLLQMCYRPRRFGIYDSRTLAVVWEALANRGNDQIGAYLGDFVSDHEGTELGVIHYPDKEATIARARSLLYR